MLSMGPTYFLLFLQVVTALLPDLVVKIFEDSKKTAFIRKEQRKVKQIKLRKSNFNANLEMELIFDKGQKLGQLETSPKASNMSESTRI